MSSEKSFMFGGVGLHKFKFMISENKKGHAKTSTHRKGSKERNLLPVSNLSIYTSNSNTSFRDKVSILRFREQINSFMLQKSSFLKVIIVKQPGVIINLVEM